METYPVLGANIAQILFNKNEKTIVPSHSVSTAYQNMSTLSDINSMPQLINDMEKQMPAFLDQAHLSTYYQDNPWGILTASNKFGVQTMGGDLKPDQSPGHRPGNILSRQSDRPSDRPSMPSVSPANRREGFENDKPIQIKWQ
jgi:hypothetical protein